MIDIVKQIEHWRTGSSEDWSVAKELVERGLIRHGLFFAHLALEKQLKSHICKTTQNLAPPLHNLTRLAELSGIIMDDRLLDLLAEVSRSISKPGALICWLHSHLRIRRWSISSG